MVSSPTCSSSIAEHPKYLDRLPTELLRDIFARLPNRDLKSLRLSCKFVRDRAPLRITRVFISANPRNVQVLRAIADHETFRKGITEIIWDDACLSKSWESEDSDLSDDSLDSDDELACPERFAKACKESVWILESRKGFDIERPDHVARSKQLAAQIPLSQSWAHYQELLHQQDEVIASESDVHAFRYGLQRFPSLRRITITPATHGFTFEPLYETPMIRSFPYGFIYPLPRGWPTAGDTETEPRACGWDEGDDRHGLSNEEMKNQWRGFRIIARVLAQRDLQHQISELVLDVHHLNTGLNCHIFDQPCEEYDNLVTLLRRPGFRRIDLSLLVGGLEYLEWSSYRNGYLRRALAEATDLEHVSLHTNVVPDPDNRRIDRTSRGSIEHFNPLRTIFPIDKWPRLRHFGLSGFMVTQADVLSLLSALPATVRSAELSYLLFLDNGGNYRSLLYEMRDTLGWHDRPIDERPKVAIGVDLDQKRPGRAIWANDETEAFLYHNGANPFGHANGWAPNQVLRGTAGIERDEFNPAYERPFVRFSELQRLGIAAL
ncbi:Fc.00g001620.m01.CDS01 [Cosmosporella sp. VM-42]